MFISFNGWNISIDNELWQICQNLNIICIAGWACNSWCSYIVSWEPEGRYQYSKMFCWEPEGGYRCVKVYGDSTLLVLNRISLKSDSALLTLNWRDKPVCTQEYHKDPIQDIKQIAIVTCIYCQRETETKQSEPKKTEINIRCVRWKPWQTPANVEETCHTKRQNIDLFGKGPIAITWVLFTLKFGLKINELHNWWTDWEK